jgi:hypothetical protein
MASGRVCRLVVNNFNFKISKHFSISRSASPIFLFKAGYSLHTLMSTGGTCIKGRLVAKRARTDMSSLQALEWRRTPGTSRLGGALVDSRPTLWDSSLPWGRGERLRMPVESHGLAAVVHKINRRRKKPVRRVFE